MPEYDNPAGRLHDLLERFSAESGSIMVAWGKVLNVPESEVPLHLGDVGRLLREVHRAAEQTGIAAFDPIPQHLQTLSNSVFPVATAFNAASAKVAPDSTSMQALAMLSAYLHQTASEGDVPSSDEVDPVKQRVRDLHDEIYDSALPPQVKRALLQRLAQMLEALEHLDVGGPEAVRRAAEALAATAVIYGEDAGDDAPTVSKVKLVAKAAWDLFKVSSVVVAALNGWDVLLNEHLLPGPPEPPQLSAGPQPSDDAP